MMGVGIARDYHQYLQHQHPQLQQVSFIYLRSNEKQQ